jgi:hypothetical protein
MALELSVEDRLRLSVAEARIRKLTDVEVKAEIMSVLKEMMLKDNQYRLMIAEKWGMSSQRWGA